MNLDFLQEAFKKLEVLNEDTFEASDDGVNALADLKATEDDTKNIVDVIDPEANDESELKDSYVNKVILECPICHSFLFNDRDSLDIDLDSHLANANQECPYCCEVGGFNIIGQVQAFEEESEEDTSEDDTTDVPVDAEEVSGTEETAEVSEDETPVEESLTEDKCEDTDCEEGLIGDVNLTVDANGNDVKVGTLGEECTDEVCEECDNGAESVATDDTLNEIGPIAGAALAGAGAGLLGGAIGTKLFSDLQVVENNLENSIADVINKEFGIDNWTTFEFDDEDVETEGDGEDATTKFVGQVKVLNGEDELGTFVINDGKLVKAEDEENDEDESDDEESEKDECVATESVDTCPKCGKNPCECTDEAISEDIIHVTRAEFDRRSKEFQDACDEVGKYNIKLAQTSNGDIQPDFSETPTEMKDDAEKALKRYKNALANFNASQMIIDENLSIETTDDTTVVSDGDKEVTITDATTDDAVDETSVEAPVAEEETTEEAGEETIVPLNDEEKNELTDATNNTEEAPVENASEEATETEPEEVEADVDEIEEEAFDRLSEKYLKKTYENVESYKTTSATAFGNSIKLEGVITFKSGKTKNTSFIFEAKDITTSGRARFVGENASLCKGKKAFTVTGALKEGKFLSESLNYNYSAKDVDGKSTRVYGTVSNKR